MIIDVAVENLIQSIMTSIYMVVLWFPLAIFIVFKIIFMKNNLAWGKTEHGTAKVSNESKIDKAVDKEETLINA